MRLKRHRRRLRFEPLETRCLLATFIVLNTQDSGAGSLRQAIIDANASLDGGNINFQIPPTDPNHIDVDSLLPGGDAEPDVWRIQPLSELPPLSNPVFGIDLNGVEQTVIFGNLNPRGPEIVLDGNGLVANGLVLASGLNTVVGLNIQRFGGHGIEISGGPFNRVMGNYIGTNATGTLAAGNGLSGVHLTGGAGSNLIGTDGDGAADVAERNVLSGNLQIGISIEGPDTSNNKVSGNFIGTDALGTARLPNGQRGISVFGGAHGNIIGTHPDGPSGAEANVISGNTESGVVFSGTNTMNNLVAGNFLGTDLTGTIDLGNLLRGVSIFAGASFNTVGGASPAARNIISGNDLHGVLISGVGTSNNVVIGNRIGTNAAGNLALPNSAGGILIDMGASANRIGTNGDGANDAAEANVLSGNQFAGVGIADLGTMLNVVAGNFIGTNPTGTSAIPNQGRGVDISRGAQQNLIGTNADGTGDAAEANVISGNGVQGIGINGANTSFNVVAGNFIGTAAGGLSALGNGEQGIVVFNAATSNRIGGATVAARNIISGNQFSGVRLTGAGVSNNHVAGNYVGLNATGNGALPNLSEGVLLDNLASGNFIGTNGDGLSDAGERNVISGNGTTGVRFVGPSVSSNVVAGNFIGTDASGLVAVPNGTHGVGLSVAATNNRIGTNGDGISDSEERNVISGNVSRGILISGDGTNNNVIAGNFIGTNATASNSIPNGIDGVLIQLAAKSNRVGTNSDGQGDAAERNIIAGNTGAGVNIIGAGTTGNVVAGNSIGADAAGALDLGNGADGVRFQDSAESNLVLGNTIAFNNQNGVELSSTAGTGNAILGNSIFSNAFFGIDLNADQVTPNDDQDFDEGPNRLQNTPEIVEAILGASKMRVTYFVPTALANATFPLRVEFFLADEDSHEGRTFLGADVFTAADFQAGSKSVAFVPSAPVITGASIVATATDFSATGLSGNTSEFSVDVTTRTNPWYNAANPLNVNGQPGIDAGDALDIINYLNAFGAQAVPLDAVGPPFYDVDGDFIVAAADALEIINLLNAFGPQEEPEASGEASSHSQGTSAVFAELGAQEWAGSADLAALLADSVSGGRARRSRAR